MVRLLLLVIGASFIAAKMLPSAPPKPAADAQSEHRAVRLVDPNQPDRTSMVTSNGGVTEIVRNDYGQFRIDGTVNGSTINFLVDTGADTVALTVDDARRAGLYVDETQFEVVGMGASGPTRGQMLDVSRIEVAGHTITNERVMVLEGLGTNLLGQSVIGRFAAVEMSGDKMVIR